MPNVTTGSFPITWSTKYTLVLPDGPPPAGGWPLVAMLHGARDDGARLRERLSGLEASPFALLYPDGPFPLEVREPPPARVGFAWYQYTGDAEAFVRSMEESGAHLDRWIANVVAEHPIDPRRVALLGYSQGGYLASYHALRHPDRFRALVAIGCRIKVEALGDGLESARGFPVLVIHGKKDEFVKWATQAASVAALSVAGVDVTVHATEGGHGLKPEFARVIAAFLGRVLASKAPS